MQSLAYLRSKSLACGVLFSIALITVGCGRSTEPPSVGAARIELRIAGLNVPEPELVVMKGGAGVPLEVIAYEENGERISLGTPRYFSRRSQFVSIDNDGVVRGIEVGGSWIVAELESGETILRDSLLVLCAERLGARVLP